MQLLVSVRDALEAEDAVAAGADVIDVKEPRRGSLGVADIAIVRDIVGATHGRRLLSVVIGDAGAAEATTAHARTAVSLGANLVKVGFAGADMGTVTRVLEQLADAGMPYIAVAYADNSLAGALVPEEILDRAARYEAAGFLVDTWRKDRGTLLRVIELDRLATLAGTCRALGLSMGIAGGLGRADVEIARQLDVDVFGVRGAACSGGRTSRVSRARVAELVCTVRCSVPGVLSYSA